MVRTWLVLLLLFFSVQSVASQDPTAPLGWINPQESKTTSVKRKPLPELQSIVCGEARGCSAVLNGRVVLAGEQVSGYRVSQIKPEVVTLVRGGKQWNLNLFSLEVKK